MKMKKFFITVSLLLCSLFLFTSCGAGDTPILYQKEKSGTVLSQTSQLSQLDGYTLNSSGNGSAFAVFQKYDSSITSYAYSVVNVDTGSIILSRSANSSYRYTYEPYTTFFVEKEFSNSSGNLTKITLYDYNGNEIAKKTDSQATGITVTFADFSNLIKFGDDYYRLNSDKTITKEFNGTFRNIPAENTVIARSKDYRLVSSGNLLFIYDKNYELKSNIEVPAYATLGFAKIFDNGNVFYQYIYDLDSLAKKYDFYESGVKVNVETKLFTLKNNKIKDVKTDFVLSGATFTLQTETLSKTKYLDDKYQAVLSGAIYKIENERLIKLNGKAFGVTDKGKFTEIKAVIDNQDFGFTPIQLANENFIVKTLDGQYFIYNVAENKTTPIKYSSYNNNYVIYNSKIYDLYGNQAYNTDGYTLAKSYNNMIVLADTSAYYIYNNGSNTRIGDITDVTLYSNCYVVKTVNPNTTPISTSYTIYNANGGTITTINDCLGFAVFTFENTAIIRYNVNDNGTTVAKYLFVK